MIPVLKENDAKSYAKQTVQANSILKDVNFEFGACYEKFTVIEVFGDMNLHSRSLFSPGSCEYFLTTLKNIYWI